MKHKDQPNANSRREFIKNASIASSAIIVPSLGTNAMVNVFNEKS